LLPISFFLLPDGYATIMPGRQFPMVSNVNYVPSKDGTDALFSSWFVSPVRRERIPDTTYEAVLISVKAQKSV
jgi:hypothetical protein